MDTTESPLVKELPFLTERQLELLNYISVFFNENRYMPTRREISAFLGLRSDNATAYLTPLLKKGYLDRCGERARRNLVLTELAVEKLNHERLVLMVK